MPRTIKDIPKRHCMVVYAHYPIGETRVQRQAEALIDHGFEVGVICLREKNVGEPSFENVNGVQVYRVPLDRRKKDSFLGLLFDYLAFFVLAMIYLIRLQIRRRYHTVQVHNLPDFLIFAAWFPKMTGTPLILDLHDLMPEFFMSRSGQDSNSFGVRLLTWQEKISCRFANHVITVTDLWRRTLIERGVPPEKVSVVMNVADNRIFQQQAESKKPAANGHFTLVYHGLQAQRYGLDLVLQAIAAIKEEFPNIQLLLHGNGEYHRTLKNIAQELNVSDRVNFSTGYVDVAELPRLIGSANVGVVPYRRDVFTDGILPTKLMEYVALGIPVIAARTPIIEEYFDDTMVEFFTPDNPDELAICIQNLYQNETRRTALAQNAGKFSDHYSWTKLSGEYVKLVEDVVLA